MKTENGFEVECLGVVNPDARGNYHLWKVSPPVRYGYKKPQKHADFVITSIATDPFSGRAETFMFPADPTGKIVDFGELTGSQQGIADHNVIRNLNHEEVWD